MKTFIRAVEYWVPSRDRSILEFGDGLYGSPHSRFAALSRELCFGLGEGLPGQAWEAGHPLVLKKFEGSYFRRTAAAHAEGLTCGIALPIFAGDFLTSVLVIFCGDDSDLAGAIELWHNDPSQSPDMTLVDGHYGNTGDAFEFISRSTIFRRGNGLPGMAWERQKPVFISDLGKGSGFLRADSAQKVGINRGFAVPCPSQDGSVYVMAFLSALATPIARRVEIWEPDAARRVLTRTAGFCESEGTLKSSLPDEEIHRGEGPLGQAFSSGIPSIRAAGAMGTLPGARPDAGPMLAVPILHGGRLMAVAALYL